MKKIYFLALALFVLSCANAQFKVSGGGTFYNNSGKIPKDAQPDSDKPSYLSYGVFIYPKYLFNVKENSSFSIGAPLSIAAGGEISTNSRTGSSSSFIAEFDVPVTFDYNIGYGSTKDVGEDNSTFGGFIGAGFGFTSSSNRYSYITTSGLYKDKKLFSAGPMVHAGMNLYVANRGYFLRGAYKMGFTNLKFNSVYLSFGTLIN
jgi:hypothetical protein